MRWLAYLVSQYVWLAVVVAALCLAMYVPRYDAVPPIASAASRSPFDPALLPDVFIHFSDVHLNHRNLLRQGNWSLALNITDGLMGAPPAIITGDLADNFPEAKIPKYGRPQAEDLPEYIDVLRAHPNITYADVAGNHDLFGVLGFHSPQSYYARYKNVSQNEFRLSIVNWQIGSHNVTLLLANPFEFPSPHPPLMYNVRATRVLLDLLEDAVDSLGNSTNAFCVHYPFNMWKLNRRSKKGRTIGEILTAGNVHWYLSGHLHPPEPIVQHHGPLLEVVGVDLMEHHTFGVVTLDNGRFAYHTVNIIAEPPKLTFVTHPVRKHQLTPWTVFNDPNTSVRLISFQNATNPPSISVSGDARGALNCTRFEARRYWLCSLPLPADSHGDLSITFSGDYTGTVDFVVANSVTLPKEFRYEDSDVLPIFIAFWVIWALQLVIVLPFGLGMDFTTSYFNWLENDAFAIIKVSHWPFSIIGGFLGMKLRINRLPWLDRISLLVAVLWAAAGPFIITNVEGHVGAVWAGGHIIDGQTTWFVWGGRFALMYCAAVVAPHIIWSSALAVFPHPANLLDAAVVLGALAGNLVVAIRYGSESAGKLAAIAPGFVLVPLYLYVLAIVRAVAAYVEYRQATAVAHPSLIDQGLGEASPLY
jgi:hypothetical protein